MLKKITLSLMVSVLCIQQSLAGSGSSTPLKEEKGDQPIRRVVPAQRTAPVQRFTPLNNRDDDKDAIVTGLAGLAIGGALIYGLYKASQDPESPRKSSKNFRGGVLEPAGIAASNLNSRKATARNYEDNFTYSTENFSEEAWRHANGLPNSFSTSNSQRRYERPIYPERSTIKASEDTLNSASSYSETENSSEFSEEVLQLYKGCPVIDLSGYEEATLEGTPTIDLHPVYNGKFKKYLRDEIFKRQLAYQRSETNEKKFYINAGTGKKRPGPNFRLQNTVSELLKEDYFNRRIAYYRLEKEGFFAIFLRKNIRPIAAK